MKILGNLIDESNYPSMGKDNDIIFSDISDFNLLYKFKGDEFIIKFKSTSHNQIVDRYIENGNQLNLKKGYLRKIIAEKNVEDSYKLLVVLDDETGTVREGRP
jgi:hypothetical protein